MKDIPYDPRNIRVEDQRKDNGARARRGIDYRQRYIDAAIEFIRRNPTSPYTALDEEDAFKARQQQERWSAFNTGGGLEGTLDPFVTAKMLREKQRILEEEKLSEPEKNFRRLFGLLFGRN